jgi:ABC-type dipeptide/oligopeptide/nickel transport system permease subunit
VFGAHSGFAGGATEILLLNSISLVESVPWLFLFLTVRALLPLNVGPSESIWITFAMLALLGWTHAARVFQAAAREFRHSDAILYARACGIGGWRLWLRQALPGLRQVSITQFTILIPTFILAEAGLGLLGLGVSEPLPSLGNLLRQLENRELVHSNPIVLVPLGVLVVVMLSFRAACGDLELTS